MDPMILALLLFAAMYVLLLIFAEKRWIIALAAALVFLVLGILPWREVFGAINWNVLMMLAGTMATVELFIQSNMPARMAEKLLQKVPNVQWAVVALSLFSGLISAFVDNVATVLMVAPVGLAVAKKLQTNPVPVIIAIAVSSNLQGAATLVGDTTSILLAGAVDMSFNDFFWFHGKLGIAWAVEVGALLTVPVLLWLFRAEKGRKIAETQQKIQAATGALVQAQEAAQNAAASLQEKEAMQPQADALGREAAQIAREKIKYQQRDELLLCI